MQGRKESFFIANWMFCENNLISFNFPPLLPRDRYRNANGFSGRTTRSQLQRRRQPGAVAGPRARPVTPANRVVLPAWSRPSPTPARSARRPSARPAIVRLHLPPSRARSCLPLAGRASTRTTGMRAERTVPRSLTICREAITTTSSSSTRTISITHSTTTTTTTSNSSSSSSSSTITISSSTPPVLASSSSPGTVEAAAAITASRRRSRTSPAPTTRTSTICSAPRT